MWQAWLRASLWRRLRQSRKWRTVWRPSGHGCTRSGKWSLWRRLRKIVSEVADIGVCGSVCMAFVRCVREDGADALASYLAANEAQGLLYHRDTVHFTGDYDISEDEAEILRHLDMAAPGQANGQRRGGQQDR